MAGRELSKVLMPCSVEEQELLRRKYNEPNSSFYSNERGELFFVVSKKYVPGMFDVSVLQVGKGGEKREKYYGLISFTGNNCASVSLGIHGQRHNCPDPPPLDKRGGQVFRTVIEEALRLGAKRVELFSANDLLEKYYAKKFGFSKARNRREISGKMSLRHWGRIFRK